MRCIANQVGHGRAKQEISRLSYDDRGPLVVSWLNSFSLALPCQT